MDITNGADPLTKDTTFVIALIHFKNVPVSRAQNQ